MILISIIKFLLNYLLSFNIMPSIDYKDEININYEKDNQDKIIIDDNLVVDESNDEDTIFTEEKNSHIKDFSFIAIKENRFRPYKDYLKITELDEEYLFKN